jgi:hypothetical protein
MNSTEFTYGRALEISWGYVWRSFVLVVPVIAISLMAMFSIAPFPGSGY